MSKSNRQHIKKITGSEIPVDSPTFPHFNHTPSDFPQLSSLAGRYEGKLLLREEIPLTDQVFQSLLKNHCFIPVPSIQQRKSHLVCTRCQNKSAHLFASLPCMRCHNNHLYCRHCIRMGRVMACEPLYQWGGPSFEWHQHENPCTWLGKLTYAQQIGANRIQKAVVKQEYLISWAVTGAGKTEMLFPAISSALKKGMRICIASPRTDVIRELLPRFKTAFQSVHIQGLYSGSRDNDGTAQLILATTHQLFRYTKAFDVLVIDEVDAFPYHQDSSLQKAAERAAKENAAIIHLTATPRKAQMNAIENGKAALVFVPVRFHGHPLIVPQWKMSPRLKKDLARDKMLPKVFSEWLRIRPSQNRQLLIFLPTIALAEKMQVPVCEKLRKLGYIESASQVTNVHSKDTDREEKIIAFRQNRIRVLLTTTILERGVTFPSVDVVVLDAGHQVFDDAALVQISGRAGRSPKDPNGEVVFFHDGLTEAMVKANEAIKQMNKRRIQLLRNGE